ncbi:hypothetical protein L1987_48735 [Smallanthus sonchifolius]|uniref:Uncharacterized protein n=1 Tax=Smallanthus sonchifolius TaxID=185202 RepID=A0ACB9FTN1_9ASTR|nr:hypothetical protein L1987_48735 [Smallanthus sonchifolius]
MEKSQQLKKKDDDLDDDKEGGDEEESNNEVEEEDDDDKEGDKEEHNEGEEEENEDAKSENDKGADDMDHDDVGEEEVENQEVEKVCKGMEQGEYEVCKGIKEGEEDVKETIVQQNVEVESEVVEDEVVEDEVVEENVVEDEVVEDEVVEDEVVANKENEEVVSDAVVVENILDDEVDNENVVKDATPKDKNKGGAAYEKVNESGGDENQDHRMKNMKKRKTKLFEANVGYTMPSLNRMGDERLLKELDNLKRLVRVREHKGIEKDDNDVDTLLTLKSPYVKRKVAMGEKITKSEALVTNYIFQATDAERYRKEAQTPNSDFMRKTVCAYLDSIGCNIWKTMELSEINRVEMTWRTLDNKVDCRIFAMRHMETFTGQLHSNVALIQKKSWKNILDRSQNSEFSKSMEGKKQDPKRDLFKELMARQDETFG